MYIPDSFQAAFSRAFYDKEIVVLEKSVTVDAEGGASFSKQAKSTFKGNVRFTNLGELQQELGLTTQIDVAVTCKTTTDIAVDDLMQYGGHEYLVTDVVPSDSHLTIVGSKWQR